MLNSLGNPIVETLFIGGGTPSVVPLTILSKFLFALKKMTEGRIIEYTMELNPETVYPELLKTLEYYSINRLSIGIQSLDDQILKILGRNTNRETSTRALETIGKNWKGSVNVDLINSVPGQNVKSALKDIAYIAKISPDHISLYNLTFEKSTKLHSLLEQGKLIPLSESVDSAIQIESSSLLESLGYKQYEVSNYSVEGRESLHNLNYWNMGAYLGIGPSGASTLMSRNGPVRIEQLRSTKEYLKPVSFYKRSNIEILLPGSFLLEHFMMGFRLFKGLDIIDINNIFNTDIFTYLHPVFKKWNSQLLFNGSRVSLNKQGILKLNSFLLDIAAHIDENPLNIQGSEINWPRESLQS